jgi:DUF4097 and DUF4098 domain-containing protein YvlB
MSSSAVEQGQAPRLRITTGSGTVTVTAEPRADVIVERAAVEASDDGVLDIQGDRRSSSLHVRCPTGAALMVGTTSGGVRLDGSFGSVSITTASGSVRADEVARADVRTRSGAVELGECNGPCRVSTTSGKVVVGRAGEADISTVAGKVDVAVEGAVNIRTVSGHVKVEAGGAGPVAAHTVSGAVDIRLPKGVRPGVTIAGFGRVRCDCEQGDDVAVDVATVGGRVEIASS